MAHGLELEFIRYAEDVAALILLNIALECTLIALIINVISSVVVEVVVEIKTVLLRYLELGTNTCTVASYVVVDGEWLGLEVVDNLWCVERVVELEHEIWCPARVAYVVLHAKLRTKHNLGAHLLVAVHRVGAECCLHSLTQ